MNIGKWNPVTRVYDPYTPDPSWRILLYANDMDEEINCANCGKLMPYGETYTSRVLHTSLGMGYPVCDACYTKEEK